MFRVALYKSEQSARILQDRSHINHHLSQFRGRKVQSKWLQRGSVAEVAQRAAAIHSVSEREIQTIERDAAANNDEQKTNRSI